MDLWAEGHKTKRKRTPSADVFDALKKIQEIKESQSRTQSSLSSLKDDGLSQVLREDKPGRTVVGLGLVVTQGKLKAQAHATKIMDSKRKYEALEDKVDKIIQIGNKSGQVGENRSGSENVQPTQVTTTESQHDSTTNEPLPG